ncbi:putative palmitoyltransferase ZDHHC12 [Trypanosoma rangeli]|uniref:Palmitoyltransferase n=1 Tax=Trypanosoma rangeli TaxID=5698 RepID=A0A3R7KDX8_TRYRA|nr:putative palmitoyltransferase ZDHHC12 [Trypanosoma rangeli]RNF06079.1 putative palmitoyltransferase ZDHHC12 [Trypanosoma rangeli]|eukprot:RNF06079.1 putative palmitoyltransferase ZDHHC12 [Trypanosoma rangeli]
MPFVPRWRDHVSVFGQETVERRGPSRVAAASRLASVGAAWFLIAAQALAAVVLFFWASMDLADAAPLVVLVFSFNAMMVWNWTPDPGFVTDSVELTSVEDRSLFHWCCKCRLWQPLRAKHCDRCERCVRKYDHHCFWIGGCVGEANHPRFYLLLTVALAYLLCLVPKFLRCFNLRDSETLTNVFLRNVVPFVLLVVGGLMLCLVFALWVVHGVLLARNQTTWEFASRYRITYLCSRQGNPFDHGFFWNISFLFHRGPVEWHLVMSHDDTTPV